MAPFLVALTLRCRAPPRNPQYEGNDKWLFIAADDKLDTFYKAKKIADVDADTILVEYPELKKVSPFECRLTG